MAFEYQGFATLGVNLNRQKYGPLDISNVFTSENDLKYYLTKGAHTEGVSKYWYESATKRVVPYPYEGQVLATVIDGVVNVYVLSLDAEGNFQTQEIAGKIEVDGKTIKLNAAGKLELVGLPADVTGKTLVPSLVNGELTWAEPDTSTAEGQQQAIDGLNNRTTSLEATVYGKEAVGSEGDENYQPEIVGLVEKVEANAQAIADEVQARDLAIQQVEAKIPDVSGKADSATTLAGYGITDAYTKEEVNSAISAMTHLSTKIVEAAPTADTAESGVIYLVADDNATGTYIEYILVTDGETKSVEQIGSTATNLDGYITSNDLAPYAKTEDVITKDAFAIWEESNTEAINTAKQAGDDAASALNDYKEDMAQALSGKVDNATLADYYTSAQIDAKGYAIAETVNAELNKKANKTEVYTKTEVDSAIGSATTAAADIKLSLEDYRDAVNVALWGEDAAAWTTKTTDEDGKVTVTYNPQYSNTSRVGVLENAVAELKKGFGDFMADDGEFADLVSKVNSNTERISDLETANKSHATEYANLKTKVDTAVDTTIPALTNRVAANEASLVAINNVLDGTPAIGDPEDEGYVAPTEGLKAAIAKKANAADVYTKEQVEAKLITSGEVVRGTADSVSITDNKITVTVNSYTKGEVDTAISEAIAAIDNTAIINNAADLAVLVGSDKDANGRVNKSIRAIAAEEINTLIKAADPANDVTIENITNLVNYVDANAGEIAELLTTTKKNTDKLAGIAEGTTVKGYVDAAVAAVPALEVATADKLGGVKSATGDNKVTVAADGTMSIAQVNVNTLTLTAGDVLVLNGGSAN